MPSESVGSIEDTAGADPEESMKKANKDELSADKKANVNDGLGDADNSDGEDTSAGADNTGADNSDDSARIDSSGNSERENSSGNSVRAEKSGDSVRAESSGDSLRPVSGKPTKGTSQYADGGSSVKNPEMAGEQR